MTRKKRPYNIYLCRYCDHNRYPCGKPIDPITDHDAIKTKNGWMCGDCVREQKTTSGLYRMNKMRGG
jgi:hypothetical protein